MKGDTMKNAGPEPIAFQGQHPQHGAQEPFERSLQSSTLI